jgi:hypothetical protein
MSPSCCLLHTPVYDFALTSTILHFALPCRTTRSSTISHCHLASRHLRILHRAVYDFASCRLRFCIAPSTRLRFCIAPSTILHHTVYDFASRLMLLLQASSVYYSILPSITSIVGTCPVCVRSIFGMCCTCVASLVWCVSRSSIGLCCVSQLVCVSLLFVCVCVASFSGMCHVSWFIHVMSICLLRFAPRLASSTISHLSLVRVASIIGKCHVSRFLHVVSIVSYVSCLLFRTCHVYHWYVSLTCACCFSHRLCWHIHLGLEEQLGWIRLHG